MKQVISPLKRLLLLVIAILLTSQFLTAQSITVKGKIVDGATKSPLEGATISIKNSTKATNSNAAGEFSISADQKSKLVISNVGYDSKQINASENFILVDLSAATQQLNEVVVTALGVKKEVKRLGYSVQEVKGADLLKARESNPVNGLVGKVAGLNVGINAELLATPTVLLRGSPLNFYIVDGIPINSDTWNISPDDIETYTVLKGLLQQLCMAAVVLMVPL